MGSPKFSAFCYFWSALNLWNKEADYQLQLKSGGIDPLFAQSWSFGIFCLRFHLMLRIVLYLSKLVECIRIEKSSWYPPPNIDWKFWKNMKIFLENSRYLPILHYLQFINISGKNKKALKPQMARSSPTSKGYIFYTDSQSSASRHTCTNGTLAKNRTSIV